MLTYLIPLTVLGAALIGGVFFAFSAFVMGALAQLPPAQGVLAMQRINVVVINPAFLGVFMGTAASSLAQAALAALSWDPRRSPWLVAGGLLYGLGCFGVTLACNVPRNNRLAVLSPGTAEAAGYWTVYLREWTWWNHVRTVAALAAAACGLAALAG